MGNNAVDTNPPVGVDIHITNGGSSWLWACFAIFAVAALASLFLGARRTAGDRIFHYITTIIMVISTIAYFSMASNLGYTGVAVEFLRLGHHGVSGVVRQVFWVRYIQYFFNLPLIILALSLTARIPTAQLVFTVSMITVTVICMLAGAITSTIYKWGFFTIGLAVSIYVFYSILQTGRRYSTGLGADIGKAYKLGAIWFLFFMALYPIAWGLSEGGNVISPNAEAIFYGILDLLLFLGFAGIFIMTHHKIEPARLGLRMRTHDEELARQNGAGNSHNGNVNGAHDAANTPGIDTYDSNLGTAHIDELHGKTALNGHGNHDHSHGHIVDHSTASRI